jgi:hypothetical protein
MRDRSLTDEPAITVPFRSTLKKFQARWAGNATGTIEGRAALGDATGLSGKLYNNTGRDLHEVYLVYTPSLDSKDDMMIYLPDTDGLAAWQNAKPLDLADAARADLVRADDIAPPARKGFGQRGYVNMIWAADQWSREFLRVNDTGRYENADRAAVILSIFDRLAASKAPKEQNGFGERYELLRRSGRQFDASSAVSCGNLLIIAKSDGPLPFPLQVGGEPVKGDGTTYYQFIIPMDRAGPATRPIAPDEDLQPPAATPAAR